MDNLSFARLKLLADSKGLVNCVQSQAWSEFAGLNSSFQAYLESATNEFGELLSDLLPELMADNQRIQDLIENAMKDTLSEHTAQLKNVKSIKKYLKDSV